MRALLLSTIACGCSLALPLDKYDSQERPSVPRLVQQASATGSNTRSLVVTMPSQPVAGDALVLVSASVEDAPASVSGGATTWTKHVRAAQHVALSVWVGFAGPAASTTITVTYPVSPLQRAAVVQISEWSGVTGVGVNATSAGIGGSNVATASLVVSDRAAVVIAAAATHNATFGPPDNAFVALESVARDDTRLLAAYRIAPPANAYATKWSPASPDAWDALIIALLH